MPQCRRRRVLLVPVLCFVLLACQSAPRAVEFKPLPDMAGARTKVDVSGITYQLKFDADYPLRDFQRVLESRLREHLHAHGLEVAPKAEAAYSISGAIAVAENEEYNGWLAVPIVGSAAGGLLTLAIPYGMALIAAIPFFPIVGASFIAAGLFGPPVVAASLAAPDTTFAKAFTANIVLKDARGVVLFRHTYDYFQSDCASVYQRGSRSCKKINRTMAGAIDAFFAMITAELAMNIGP